MDKVVKSQNEVVGKIDKLSIPAIINGSFGYYYIDLDKILYLESCNNTTVIHIEDEKPITVAKVLKYFEKELLGKPFLRIHNSYIINVHKLSKYNKGTKKFVILTNGQKIDVSRSRKNVLENNVIVKYTIHTYDGLVYVDFNAILYLEANHDKTIFHLTNNKSIESIKNIGFFENTFIDKPFFRIHDKYIINMINVVKYYRGSNQQTENQRKTSGYVVLNTGYGLPVAASKKEMFLRFFRD